MVDPIEIVSRILVTSHTKWERSSYTRYWYQFNITTFFLNSVAITLIYDLIPVNLHGTANVRWPRHT